MRTRRAMIVVALGLALTGCNTTPEPGPGAEPAVPTSLSLETMDPDARTVAERVVAFVGGAEAIDNIRTLEVRFEGESDGHPMVFHLAWSRSGPAWYGMRLGPDSGRMGTNGKYYWRTLEGEEAEMFEVDPEEGFGWQEQTGEVIGFASFPLDIINPTGSHTDPAYPLHAHDAGEFKGQRADVLTPIADPQPEDPMHWHYFDPQTGRPLGTLQGLPSEPLYMAFSDWREVEGGKGLKMFHRVKVDGFWLGDEVFDLKAKFVRVNTLNEADFAPPADAVLRDEPL